MYFHLTIFHFNLNLSIQGSIYCTETLNIRDVGFIQHNVETIFKMSLQQINSSWYLEGSDHLRIWEITGKPTATPTKSMGITDVRLILKLFDFI